MCPKLIELLSWNGPTVHVCCFMLARASTKTFVSRVQNQRKNLRQPKNSLAGSLVSRGITVQLMDIIFPRLQVCVTYCKSYAYFILQSLRLSVTNAICLQFHFLVSRPGVEGVQSPSVSFCLYVLAQSVQSASNVWDSVQVQTPCAPFTVRRSISKR